MSSELKSSLSYSRIRKLARYACGFSMLGAVISIVTIAYYAILMMIDTPAIDDAIREEFVAAGRTITINGVSRTLAFVFEITPMLIGIYIFLQAVQLFRQYMGGKVFTFEAAGKLNKIGWAVTALAPLGILFETLAVLALTIYNPPGQKQLSIGISETEIYAIILGLLLVTLAKILHEAANISEENQAII
jgi:hypothetical protein